MRFTNRFLSCIWLGLSVAACDDPAPFEEERQQCVDRINELRDSIDLPPLDRWTDGEDCADHEAAQDAATGTPHGAFPECGESAQNECPGWDSVSSVVGGCIDMMWAEGPGEPYSEHGHYINMTSTSYSRVACGLYVTTSGSVWAVMNFQ